MSDLKGMITPREELIEKWSNVLDHPNLPGIKGFDRKWVTAQLLENTEKSFMESASANLSLNEAAPVNNTGNIATYDPVLISLVRRAMPNLIAYDLCGVQPMTGPSGLIFAQRTWYANTSNAKVAEAFYSESNTGFSTVRGGNTQIVGDANGNLGGNTSVPVSGNAQVYNYASGMLTAQAEALGTSGNTAIPEMALTWDKITVTAKSRKLRAQYTLEDAQDLKAIHGLDANTELTNALQTEILSEINREVIRNLVVTAVSGAQTGTTTAGIFDLDTDSNGRWMGEKYAGLHMAIELDANAVAKATRRGKGNVLLVSSNVASALVMAKVINNANAAEALQVDDTGNTFAGTTTTGMRVYIDPYAAGDYMVVGYKGPGFDSGFFYCPYVPLQKVQAVMYDTFNPAIGFQTRYGMVANPFSPGSTLSDGSLVANTNQYYRRIVVQNIM